MPWIALVRYVNQAKMLIAVSTLLGGAVVSLLSVWKIPARAEAIARTLDESNRASAMVHEQTNRKLDVLICLQAHLDTPINCVRKESGH
jgi:hypothetical protein